MNFIDCHLCGSNDFTVIKDNLVVCNHCSLGYLNPRMTKEEYSHYYKTQYDTEFRTNTPTYLLADFYNKVSPYLNVQKVLDYGAGDGAYLSLFHNEKYAVEPSLQMQEILKSKSIEIIELENQVFDFIILRHTLEHFLDPKSELLSLKNHLNGSIYIEVPNSLSSNKGRGWFRIAHTYYFNVYTLVELVSSLGYDIISTGYNREQLWVIATNNGKEMRNFQVKNYFVLDQIRSMKAALKYESHRPYRIKTKLINLFKSL